MKRLTTCVTNYKKKEDSSHQSLSRKGSFPRERGKKSGGDKLKRRVVSLLEQVICYLVRTRDKKHSSGNERLGKGAASLKLTYQKVTSLQYDRLAGRLNSRGTASVVQGVSPKKGQQSLCSVLKVPHGHQTIRPCRQSENA